MRSGRNLRHLRLQGNEAFPDRYACRGFAGFVTGNEKIQRLQTDARADVACDDPGRGEYLDMAAGRRKEEQKAGEHLQEAHRERKAERRADVLQNAGRVRGVDGKEEGELEEWLIRSEPRMSR